MSRGKYSPNLKTWPNGYEYKFTCYGKECLPWTEEMIESGVPFDDMTMFGDYDEEGFDRYGYSAFDREGNFVGHGQGVDRDGYTEMDYLTLQDIPEEHRESYYYYNS